MTESSNDLKVDAVITWVDGNDPSWQERFNKYSEKKIDFAQQKSRMRYNSIGEINIAISSIIKFASFVSNIYLVTDDQTPEGFDALHHKAKTQGINLEIVDHKAIFRDFEESLPTFNSCSIGCMLYRIPNLSEHFIVFNDDTFLMRSTSVKDFFIDEKPIIRAKKERFREDRTARVWYRKFLTSIGKKPKERKSSFKNFQETSAKLAYRDEKPSRYLRRFHTPIPMRKSTLTAFFDGNDLLRDNVAHRFRSGDQFIISSLSEHLELKITEKNLQRDTQLVYFRSYKNLFQVKLKLKKFEQDHSKLFITFQSLDMADDSILEYISSWIKERIDISNFG